MPMASATFLHPNLGAAAAAAFSEHFFFYFSISAETASCFTPRSGFPRLQSLRYSEEIHVGRNLMPPVSCFLPESAALFTVSLPALFIWNPARRVWPRCSGISPQPQLALMFNVLQLQCGAQTRGPQGYSHTLPLQQTSAADVRCQRSGSKTLLPIPSPDFYSHCALFICSVL